MVTELMQLAIRSLAAHARSATVEQQDELALRLLQELVRESAPITVVRRLQAVA